MANILIIEDDHNLGIMIKDLLEFKGYEVILSRNPQKATKDILQHNIDLILLDKLISGVDGTDVCAEIRNNEAVAEKPVLMMSALNDARNVCLKAGATDFIYKPFDLNDLYEKVEKLLEKI